MNSTLRNTIIISLVLIAAFSRLIPHAWNFTPMAAIALFAGAMLGNRLLAILLPVAALFLSDLTMQLTSGNGFYDHQWTVYLGFMLAGLTGRLIRHKLSAGSVLAGAVGSSFIFFLLSNFGAWLAIPEYPATPEGLLNAYVAGIPFYRGTLLGDLFFTGLLFGGWALLSWRIPALQAVRKNS